MQNEGCIWLLIFRSIFHIVLTKKSNSAPVLKNVMD